MNRPPEALWFRTIHAKAVSRLSSLIDFHTNRPTAALVFAFSLGIGLSLRIQEYWFAALAAAGIPLICAALIGLRRDRAALSLTLGLLAVAWGGLLMALAHRDGFSDSDLRSLLARGAFRLDEPVSFEGCVTADCEMLGEESVVTVELRAFREKDHWVACRGKGLIRVAGYGAVDSQSKISSLLQGDTVRGWATWRRPRNYGNPGSADRKGSLARRGIFVIGRVKSPRLLESVPGGCSTAWTRLAVTVRNRVRESLEPIRLSERGQPAAILASLVIGDYSRLDASTRETFQNAGTFHVLVVSGLHVAWIAGLLLQLFRLIGFPERVRFGLVALVILFYTCVVGFQASITRCLWMFVLYLAGRSILRRADTVNVLLASALLLLAAQPDWLFEAGFQLSFLSVTAIAMTAVPAIESYLVPLLAPLRNCGNPDRLFLQPGRWHRWGRNLHSRWEILMEATTDRLPPAFSSVLFKITRGAAGAALAVGSTITLSLSIQLWIEPVLAHYFNRMSWISALANLVIVPFSSLVLASGILTALASGLPFCGPALIHFAGTLSSLLLRWAGNLTAVNGAWQRCPTPSAAWILAGILLLFLWSYFKWRRLWIPCFYAVVLLACISQGSVPVLGTLINECNSVIRRQDNAIWPEKSSVLSFTFLDVGEGDSVFIRFPNQSAWLVDVGGLLQAPSQEEDAYAFDLGEVVVSRFLWHAWIARLDRLVLSHTDLDHSGGARSVLRNFRVARVDHSHVVSDKVLAGILDIARTKQVSVQQVYGGTQERIGPVVVEAIHPPANSISGVANENSLVLRFSFRRFSALLTGDLDRTGESRLLSRSENLRGLLLKVAHHGSRSGTSNAFLDAAQPRWAIVSVGRHNPYGHPSPEALHRLLQHGSRFYLTLDQGAVTFETDGAFYVLRSYIGGILEQGSL
jgi:competence protein ComEC